jgi:hypothetical protein
MPPLTKEDAKRWLDDAVYHLMHLEKYEDTREAQMILIEARHRVEKS